MYSTNSNLIFSIKRNLNIYILISISFLSGVALGAPISIHPGNPHYYLYKGKPTVLITSAEHYGAVINKGFDYIKYLDQLKSHRMNYTRIYPGSMIENEDQWIKGNTVAPTNSNLIVPWARSSVIGYAKGGNKFDLNIWDMNYFKRLKDFVQQAGVCDIIVEVCFFNAMYPSSWNLQILNSANNIQGVGNLTNCNDFQTLKDSMLVLHQDAYITKIVQELNNFDNVIFEICDEPGISGTSPSDFKPWLEHHVLTINKAESTLPKKHLIGQQITFASNGGDISGNSNVNILIGQYVRYVTYGRQEGGLAVLDKWYSYDKPAELNETNWYPLWYHGDKIGASRVEAWEFIVGGGASFNQLNGLYTNSNPTGTGKEGNQLQNIMLNLRNFIESFDFVKMHRDTSTVVGGVPVGSYSHCISEPGKQYAFYIHHSVLKDSGASYQVTPGKYTENLAFNLPAGQYTAEWVNPNSGKMLTRQIFSHKGGIKTLTTPTYSVDMALRIKLNLSEKVPTVSITSPDNGATFSSPANISIGANAVGNTDKVEFYSDSTLIGIASSYPYSFTWCNVSQGSYSVTAKAFNPSNISASSSPTFISVSLKSKSTIPEGSFTHHYIFQSLPENIDWGYGCKVLADFDGDKILEFTTLARDGSFYWFKQEKDSSWSRYYVWNSKIPENLGAMASDIDGDGKLDIITGRFWYRNTGKEGDKKFQQYDYDNRISHEIHDIAVVDMNNDGEKEVIALGDESGMFMYKIPANPANNENWDRFDFLSVGVKVLNGEEDIHGGFAPNGIADLDGDGDLDIVFPLYWLENQANGRKWTEHNYGVEVGRQGPYGNSIRSWIVDINHDDELDIVYTNCDMSQSQAGILLNRGKAKSWEKILLPGDYTQRGDFHSLAVADFDGDGDLDIMTGDQEGLDVPPIDGRPKVFIYENSGDNRTFTRRIIFDGMLGIHDASIGDINGDGNPDIVSSIWGRNPANNNHGREHAGWFENNIKPVISIPKVSHTSPFNVIP